MKGMPSMLFFSIFKISSCQENLTVARFSQTNTYSRKCKVKFINMRLRNGK